MYIDYDHEEQPSSEKEANVNSGRCSNCCSNIKDELKMQDTYSKSLPWSENVIDYKACFSPGTAIRNIRCIVFTVCIGIFVSDVFEDEAREYEIIYLTRWSALVTYAFLLCSLICSALPDKVENSDGSASLLTKVTWELAVLGMSVGAVVVIMFWVAVYNGGGNFYTIWNHGILFSICLLDALGLGCVPVRMKQIRSVASFAIAYLCWSIFHSFSGIGNGITWDDDSVEDDDAIYQVLSWKNRPGVALAYSAFVMIFLLPVMFLMVRQLSLLSQRSKFFK